MIYLDHESAAVRLTSPNGPQTAFKVFGSPYSPARGLWGFGYPPGQASGLWDQIPLDTDVLVTHTPPKYHCDESRTRGAIGCETLREALWRVRPRLAVCGHVHEGRGVETVQWDLSSPNVKYKEQTTRYWTDPGTGNKQSLVDLTRRAGKALANDGSIEDDYGACSHEMRPSLTLPNSEPSSQSQQIPLAHSALSDVSPLSSTPTSTTSVLQQVHGRNDVSNESLWAASTRGQGGLPPSGRCDVRSLSGRLGRKETCIINAAIVASSWPHKGSGGKRFNKPIVVDIELPVWAPGVDASS